MSGSQWGADPAVLDLVHDSIIVRDLDGRIVFWNRAAESEYGWSAQEAIGKDFLALLQCNHPETLDVLEEQVSRTGFWEGEFTRTRRDGSEVVIAARWSLVPGTTLKPPQIVETGRDVTAARRAEDSIRHNEYRLRNLFEVAAVAFWEVDFRGVGQLVRALAEQGVTDIRAHLLGNRDLVREAMRLSRVLDVNQKTVQLFAASRKEAMVGKDVSAYWPEESEAVFVEAIIATLEKRAHFITETRLLTANGVEIDVLFTVSSSPESRKDGVILLGVVDIGEQKQAQRRLEQSELRYRSIFNRMPMGFWQIETGAARAGFDAMRAAGIESFAEHAAANPGFAERAMDLLTVSDVNEETIRMMGASCREDLLGPMSRVWSDVEEFIHSSEARYQGADTYGSVSKMNTLDGRVIDVLWRTIFSDQLSDTGINLIGTIDVTERRKAIEAVAQSELKYRNLFHYMPISLWQLSARDLLAAMRDLRSKGVTDLEAYMRDNPEFLQLAMNLITVEEVNERTVRMFGGQQQSDFRGPIGRYWIDSPETIKRSLMARFSGKYSYEEETRVRTLDGRTIDVFYTSAFPPALADLGITIVGAVDISDRTRAQHALHRLQGEFAHAARVSMLGELTASIAHEVNQPLAAIATNGEAGLRWLNRPEPDIDEVRALTGRIVADARRAADIIGRIRSMAAGAEPERAQLDLNRIVEEALLFIKHDLDLQGVDVQRDLAEGLPQVRGDRTQLQQVVVNLALNAAQAMGHAGSENPLLVVRTGISDDGRKVLVSCEDHGPGIQIDNDQRLFESFFSTKESGMGMGLPICRSIIEAHGGSIEGGNRSDQRGARFTFQLPAAKAYTKV